MTSALHRVVRETVALGVLLPLLALAVLRDAGPVLPLGSSLPGSGHLLLLALLLLTMLANLVAVPVRRGDHVEELTLLESALIVDVLLLPAAQALWLPAAAVLASSVLTRRAPVKSLFNAGSLAASSALLVVLVHLSSRPGDGLSLQTVAGLVAGLLAFTAVNLANLTRVLVAVEEAEARTVLSDGWRLAVLTLPGHLSIAGTGVLAAGAAPALVPFAFVPAVALVVALRARAHEAAERTRARRLLALSNALAVRRDSDDLVATFLRLCCEAFDADSAMAVLEGDDGRPVVQLAHRRTGAVRRSAEPGEVALLDADSELLPCPRRRRGEAARAAGVLTPLEAAGQRLGVLVLRTGPRPRRTAERELLLIIPLARLLAASLQGADHLQRLTEATGRLQAVVDQSSDGILVLDGAGVVQLWSPTLAALTGTDAAHAVGRPLRALWRVRIDGADGDAFAAGRALLAPDRQQATVELELLREDGEPRALRCAHAAAFVGDRLLRDVVLVHDVTRERQLERLKADFVATVSHELRTPVTPIKGYADLLRRHGDTMTPERRQECLAVISDRSAHLARLVEDLLLASRISTSPDALTRQVRLTASDLAALVRQTAAELGRDSARLRLSLPDRPLPVPLDPLRTGQVLFSLFDNALKYSAPGTPVDVTLADVAGSAVVAVVDRGRGIPADQLEQVFEQFHRVEDPLRMTTGGTGLGLYLARQLAVAMGGTPTCRSTLGVGSTFRLALPLTREQPHLPGPVPAPDVVALA